MFKSVMLLICMMLCSLSLVASVLVNGADPPNILLIYADDHSPRMLSCHAEAYPLANTPNIDRLASQGVRFTAAYLGSWCMPSRASVLTGLHPHAIKSMRMTGRNPRSTYDPEKCRFWLAALRAGGYHTAQIGKWHTGTDAGFGRDWDFQIVWNRPANPENATAYFRDQFVDRNGVRETMNGYSTDQYSQWAAEYIMGEGRQPDKPWFLWLCYGAIHSPTSPAQRHLGALKDLAVRQPAAVGLIRDGQPSYLKTMQRWTRAGDGSITWRDDPSGNTARRVYDDWMRQAHECMMAVDEGVGEVLKALEESGQAGNTLVIYTSDQGFAYGEQGLHQKVAPYEATYSSPFIVRLPGLTPPGSVCAHSVNAPDLAVTCLAAAGVPQPWKMPGRDFTPLLENPNDGVWYRPTLYMHTGQLYGDDVTRRLRDGGDLTHAGVPFFAAVRDAQLKYIRYFTSDEPEELYDLASDPDELRNRIADPSMAGELRRLRGAWLDEMRHASVDFLDDLPKPVTWSP